MMSREHGERLMTAFAVAAERYDRQIQWLIAETLILGKAGEGVP
jgi:hypothetical protein